MLYVRTKYPRAPLLGVGFSLGANVVTRYVAEEGDKCRLVSAVALGCVRVRYHTHGPALTYANTALGPGPKCLMVRTMSLSFDSSLTIYVGSRVAGSTARSIPRLWVATSNLSSGDTRKRWQSSKTTPSRRCWTRPSARAVCTCLSSTTQSQNSLAVQRLTSPSKHTETTMRGLGAIT